MPSSVYAYVGNDPINLVDPTGMYITAPEKDREHIEDWINSQGTGKHKFNDNGFLEKVEGEEGEGDSESFSEAVDELIANNKMGVEIFIREKASTGEDVDNVYRGGTTDTDYISHLLEQLSQPEPDVEQLLPWNVNLD